MKPFNPREKNVSYRVDKNSDVIQFTYVNGLHTFSHLIGFHLRNDEGRSDCSTNSRHNLAERGFMYRRIEDVRHVDAPCEYWGEVRRQR